MSQFPVTTELRFLKIPTQWSLSREGYLMPEVDQDPQRKLTPILDDPYDLRTEFLKLPHTSKSALRFLNKIGVWSVWRVKTITAKGSQIGTLIPGMRLDGAFGYRHISDLAVVP